MEGRESESADRSVSAAAAGTLVMFLETGGLEVRRRRALRRLRELEETDDFRTLPDELRQRIHELVRADDAGERDR